MAGYLDRLIERAAGASSRHVPASAPVATRNDDDPFESVSEVPASPLPSQPASPIEPHQVAQPHEVSIPMQSPVVTSFAEPAPRFDARVPVVHVEPTASANLPPVAPRELRPLEIARPDHAIETRTETIVRERETESQIVERTTLRPPNVEREVTTEKWLTPSTPGVSAPPVVPKLDEPTRRVVLTPPPAAAAAPPPMLPSEPASSTIAAPARDTRPSLTIGRLLVEVRQPAAPAPRTIVARPHVETSSPAPTHVFHRGFGLGQS